MAAVDDRAIQRLRIAVIVAPSKDGPQICAVRGGVLNRLAAEGCRRERKRRASCCAATGRLRRGAAIAGEPVSVSDATPAQIRGHPAGATITRSEDVVSPRSSTQP